MKLTLFLATALTVFAGDLLEKISEPASPRNIQVLLEKDVSEALLEVKGPYYLFNPHDGSKISSGLLGKRFIIREIETGLKWGEEFPGIHQIQIKPRSPETAIFINGIQYQGSVTVFGVSGLLNIVNDLDIESYVKAVLSSQANVPQEPEVLSAMAILARTDAYYRASRNLTSFWHVNAAEVHYQGAALAIPNSPIERAVNTTRHLILVHPENGKNLPFATSWTEHSAGKTAAYETIFRKDAFAPEKGVDAPHAALTREETKWTYQIATKALAQMLGVSSIRNIELFIDQSSRKVYGLRVQDTHDTSDIDFMTLQTRLGKDHLKSSDFSVKVADDFITFTGYGQGHGVGLCLYSAAALAQKGDNAVKILSKFFPETYLYNLDAMEKLDTRR